MKTGIVIIHYNDFESLKNLIDNIKDYKVLDKIVIIDNNSRKDVQKKLARINEKRIEVVISEENKGYSYAINKGSKYLMKELGNCNIIVSNSDVVINKEEDIKKLTGLLDKKDIGLVAPTIVEKEGLNRGWKNPSPVVDALMNLPVIHRLIREKKVFYKEECYETDTSIVDVASGCFFLMKSKILESINFLDENVFLYYEENILAKKLQTKKKKVLISNDVIIIHNHSVSIDKNMKQVEKLKRQKASQYYFQKKYNRANIFEKFLLRLTGIIGISILATYYKLKDLKKTKYRHIS